MRSQTKTKSNLKLKTFRLEEEGQQQLTIPSPRERSSSNDIKRASDQVIVDDLSFTVRYYDETDGEEIPEFKIEKKNSKKSFFPNFSKKKLQETLNIKTRSVSIDEKHDKHEKQTCVDRQHSEKLQERHHFDKDHNEKNNIEKNHHVDKQPQFQSFDKLHPNDRHHNNDKQQQQQQLEKQIDRLVINDSNSDKNSDKVCEAELNDTVKVLLRARRSSSSPQPRLLRLSHSGSGGPFNVNPPSPPGSVSSMKPRSELVVLSSPLVATDGHSYTSSVQEESHHSPPTPPLLPPPPPSNTFSFHLRASPISAFSPRVSSFMPTSSSTPLISFSPIETRNEHLEEIRRGREGDEEDNHRGLFDDSLDPTQIQFVMSEENVPQLIGATLERLVQILTYEGQTVDPRYCQVFLLVHSAFTTSAHLLDLIILRFDMSAQGEDPEIFAMKQHRTRLRVVNVLKMWLTKFFYEIATNDEVLLKLSSFISLKVAEASGFAKAAKSLKELLEQQISESKSSKHIREQTPLPILTSNISPISSPRAHASQSPLSSSPSALSSSPISNSPSPPAPSSPTASPLSPKFTLPSLLIKSLDPTKLAEQMTLLDSRLFKLIQPNECLNGRWMKSDKLIRSPNLIAMVDRFNKTSCWAASEVLKMTSVKTRTEVLERLILIANEFRKLNNFHGVMTIISGLGNSAVFRLKKTWMGLSKGTNEIFQQLSLVCSSDNNYALLRKLTKFAPFPCIPYMGLFMKDLIFIEDGNTDYIKGTQMINFNKHKLTADCILAMMSFQCADYQIHEIPQYVSYINNFHLLCPEAMYKLSLELEPREPQQ